MNSPEEVHVQISVVIPPADKTFWKHNTHSHLTYRSPPPDELPWVKGPKARYYLLPSRATRLDTSVHFPNCRQRELGERALTIESWREGPFEAGPVPTASAPVACRPTTRNVIHRLFIYYMYIHGGSSELSSQRKLPHTSLPLLSHMCFSRKLQSRTCSGFE